jgi:hypothetical protein
MDTRRLKVRSIVTFIVTILTALVMLGCAKPQAIVIVQEYQPAFRQVAPEPVYSRVTWSQLPQPIRPKAKKESPLILPTLSFDLTDSNLKEAIEALAQSLGYRSIYAKQIENRPVSIKMVGSVQEILENISRQANVSANLSHSRRVVEVYEESQYEHK